MRGAGNMKHARHDIRGTNQVSPAKWLNTAGLQLLALGALRLSDSVALCRGVCIRGWLVA